MIACLDVAYIEPDTQKVHRSEAIAIAACLIFETWTSHSPINQYVARVQPIADYVPGEFYKRELPPILKALELVKEPIHTIVIDGYVQLGSNRDGLGMKLFEKLEKEKTIVGVAKKSFIDNNVAVEILRGDSVRPLFVTAIGMPIQLAATKVASMHGAHRIPTLLKQVDTVVRREANEA